MIGRAVRGAESHKVADVAAKPTHDYDAASYAAYILNQHHFVAYIIGGAVRDMWLGRKPKDFDLVTNATPEAIMAIPEFASASYKDPAQAYGVTRVQLTYQGTTDQLEIATFRQDLEAHRGRKATRVAFAELEDDVFRRDFTMNALALDPFTNQVIDYVGGIDDIEQKRVRFIGDPDVRIKEDPLRIMRAIRFKNHLGFAYDPATATAIIRAVNEGYVESIAVDRLRDELTSLLLHVSRRQALCDLAQFGIVARILPEVAAGKGVKQPPQYHAEGDVWQHQLLILDQLPTHPSRRLAWAALLHDIGKGPTSIRPQSTEDHIRFNRHYAVGAEMAKTILRRLKFSNRDVNDIAWMVYHHMAIDDLPAMRPSHQQKMLGHPAFEDLLQLHRADAAASWRPGIAHGTKPMFHQINQLWHEYVSKSPELRQPSLKRDLGIDGTWLISNFGNDLGPNPGPKIGKILTELEEWYQDERVTDRNKYSSKVRAIMRSQ